MSFEYLACDVSWMRIFARSYFSPIYRVFQKTAWNIFTSVKSFCMKFCKFVGNSYPHIPTNFCTSTWEFHQMANFSMNTHRFHRAKFWVLNAYASWPRTLWESHHFQLYPDKRWKLSTVKKVCSRVDHTGSAVLRKPDSGIGRPATASACAICRVTQFSHWQVLPSFKTKT